MIFGYQPPNQASVLDLVDHIGHLVIHWVGGRVESDEANRPMIVRRPALRVLGQLLEILAERMTSVSSPEVGAKEAVIVGRTSNAIEPSL
jgi:hypothetical protein